MAVADDMFNMGLQHHRAGNLAQAEAIYRNALQYDARHGDSLHLLGVIAHQRGQHDLAVDQIRHALQFIPHFGPAYNNLGNALRVLGRLSEAAESYRQAIRLDPNAGDVYSNLGIVLREQGKVEEAFAVYQTALRLDPNNAVVHNNLGNVYREQGKLAEATACYQQALRLAPNYADAHNNMGIAVLEHLGQADQAAVYFRQAIRLNPEYADAYNNLGALLANHGNPEEARTCFFQALRLQPNFANAHRNLGLLLQTQGKLDEAIAQFREVLRLRPDDPTAGHLLTALTGAATPDHVSAEYVSTLFDGYAGHFDDHLTKTLKYQGPELVREALSAVGRPKALDILDLGCGTGLCGVVLREWARTLTGVDLSQKMLAKAKARGIYDELVHGDLLATLQSRAAAYDLAVAADVFGYVGELSAIFHATAKALRAGGHLGFLVEAHEGEGYVLRDSGRFAYSLKYLQGLAKEAGFAEVSVTKTVARKDREKDIVSWVMVLKKDKEG